jgi:hypothetical protein
MTGIAPSPVHSTTPFGYGGLDNSQNSLPILPNVFLSRPCH